MVKKLLKQEYKYYIRTLIFVYPAVLLLGVSTRVIQFFEVNHPLYYLAFVGVMLIFIIGSAAAAIATEVLGVVRFYKNMYSSEGYLTFTLPVNNHEHLISKLIAHASCSIISLLVVLVSWIIAFAGTELSSLIVAELGAVFAGIDFTPYIGHIIIFVIEFIIIFAIGIVSTPLTYYSCISIGQTAKKNRILLAIGVYYLYTVIVQVISTVVSMIFTIVGLTGILDGLLEVVQAHPLATAHTIIWFMIIVSGGIAALMYYINIRIMNNKLNLE